MSVVAAAVVGSAVVGAVASNRAASKAASAQKKGMDASTAMANQARSDATNLYQQALGMGQQGRKAGYDFYTQNAAKRQQPFVLGNMAAQNTIAQGAQQANNAILGLPQDLSYLQAQQIPVQQINAPAYPESQQIDISNILAGTADQQKSGPQQAKPSSGASKMLTANGLLANPVDQLNPINMATNPLGLGSKVTSKIDPVKKTKKLLGKIF